MERVLLGLALACLCLSPCSASYADDYAEDMVNYDYTTDYDYTEDGVDVVADLYEDYDADEMAELAQSYDYSSEDQVEVCVEGDEGFPVLNSPELQGCSMVVSSADDDFQEGIETIEGLYELKGCRKGFPFYVRKPEEAVGEPRMMWFSPQYFDWTISSTDDKRLAAKTRYLMAYGGSTYIDDSSLTPTNQWHVIRAISSVNDFYSTFSVQCAIPKPTQDVQDVGVVDARNAGKVRTADETGDAGKDVEDEEAGAGAETVKAPTKDVMQSADDIGDAERVVTEEPLKEEARLNKEDVAGQDVAEVPEALEDAEHIEDGTTDNPEMGVEGKVEVEKEAANEEVRNEDAVAEQEVAEAAEKVKEAVEDELETQGATAEEEDAAVAGVAPETKEGTLGDINQVDASTLPRAEISSDELTRSRIKYNLGQESQHIAAPLNRNSPAEEQGKRLDESTDAQAGEPEGATAYAVPIVFMVLISTLVAGVMGYRKLSGKMRQAEAPRVKYEKV